jgi:hypothetical protein
MNDSMKTIWLSILLILVLISCSSFNKRVEITPEYIINENWTKRGDDIEANRIEISKMKVKDDSTINPFSNLNQTEILDKLKIDSSFIYRMVKIKPEESYKDKKIYFTTDNGFYWWTDQGNRKTKILGKLEKDTWYEISGLTYYYYYVIYIDNDDKVHRFAVNSATNW